MLRFKKEDGSSYEQYQKCDFDFAFQQLQNIALSRDCLNYENGKTKSVHYGDILVKYGNSIDIENPIVPYINDMIDVSKIKDESLLQTGDIIFADTAEDETVGKVVEIFNTQNIPAISGLHTMAYRPYLVFANGFLGYYLNSEAYRKQLFKLMQGIKVTSINKSEIIKTKLCFPQSLEEQQKIADFLSKIDKMISVQSQQLDALKEQKKGVMQKIFNQEVRFKDDNGEDYPKWENKCFGSIIKEIKEKTTIENEDTLLSCAIDGIYLNSELFGHQRGKSNIGYLKIKKGNLILSAQNLHLGNANVNLRFEHGIVSPAYKVFEITNAHIPYISHWIKREYAKQFFFMATTVGASECRRNVDWDKLYSQSINIPCLGEQKKIANFLSKYDEAIENKQKQLDMWKTLKKGLMHELFDYKETE